MGVRVVFPDMGKDPSIQLIEKTITENGTYDAITDGANGYSKVNVNVEGGGGSSDFIICVDSASLPLDVYLNDIAEQDPDVKLSAGTAQIFTDPVYCVDMPALRMTAYYGELINMGHILGDPNNPEYFKIEGDLFVSVARK